LAITRRVSGQRFASFIQQLDANDAAGGSPVVEHELLAAEAKGLGRHRAAFVTRMDGSETIRAQ
jgi:hypothetical protein